MRDFILSIPHGEKSEDDAQRHAIIEATPPFAATCGPGWPSSQDLVAAAVADDIGADADDLRPSVVAASLIAAFEVLPSATPRRPTSSRPRKRSPP